MPRCRATRGSTAGSDLVLDPPARHFVPSAVGTLLDDHFTPEDRDAVDREALARLAAWRRDHDAALTVGNACLPWIWETELLAEVFLPVVRGVWGLPGVLTRSGVREVELVGVDRELAECLGQTLGAAGIDVEVDEASTPPVPSYPTRRGNPWTTPRGVRLRQAVLRRLGIPSLVRGRVLFMPYWNLLGLYEELIGEPGLTPIHDPFNVPAGPLGRRLRAVARGGWTGRPNAIQSERAARRVRRALRADALREDAPDPLSSLLSVRARRLLEHRAGGYAGHGRGLRARTGPAPRPGRRPSLRQPAAGPDGAGCLSHHRTTQPRAPARLLRRAQRSRQGGGRPGGGLVGTGSRRAGRAPPGADRGHREPGHRRPPLGRIEAPRDRTLVLTDYPSRQSLWPDARITATQLEMMLSGRHRDPSRDLGAPAPPPRRLGPRRLPRAGRALPGPEHRGRQGLVRSTTWWPAATSAWPASRRPPSRRRWPAFRSSS